jgi:hypothetical protein
VFEPIDNTNLRDHNFLNTGMKSDVWRGSVQEVAAGVGADFDIEYVPCGYVGDDGYFVEPLYTTGVAIGQSRDRYILRADTKAVLGVHSGKYPDRDAYSHVFDTLEQLWPNSCESITVFGDGERAVVEQVLDEPIDLGGGDEIQPYLYTRMSLNGQWKTETIPVHRRLSGENMLGYVGQIIGVRATKNHDTLLTLRSSTLDKAMAQQQTLVQMARVFKDQEFTDEQFMSMIAALVPHPVPDAHERTLTAWAHKRGAMLAQWKRECDEWGGSMWTAYNAAQGAEQHRISKNYKNTEAANQRSLTKALDGKTPIADAASDYLRALVVIAA